MPAQGRGGRRYLPAVLAILASAGFILASVWQPGHGMAWAALAAAVLAAILLLAEGHALGRQQAQADDLERRLRQLQDERDQLQQRHDQQGQLKQQLLQAKQAAEAAVLAKGEFLATMSHEIRTPLNGIIPMLDLIGRGRLEADQRQMLATALTSSRQLLRIVDDILDHSRLEANALELETTTFNLRELLEGMVQLMQRAAEAKGVRLALELDPAVRLSVRGDPVRLRQVLGNLLANAIKFTARGRVTLRVQRLGEAHNRHELRFEVVDTGIGIEPAQQSRLFQSFTQADASTTRLYGGTGLGLAICQRIVDLMGGRIGVHSTPGQGATFWFEIPLLKAAGDLADHHGAGARALLLFTGDVLLQQRVQRVAGQHGLQVRQAATLAMVLDALRAPASTVPAWLVIDGGLLRSGPGALQRALADCGGDAPQVLWLHLGDAASTTSQHWRDDLANDGELHALLRPGPPSSARPAPLLAVPPPEGGPAALPLPPLRSPPRVLLVEDNNVNMKVAQHLLQVLGCWVRGVQDGEQALQVLHAADMDVDLVLMDCQMPVLDGYAATARWRVHEEKQGLPRLPIIAMTANVMAGDRERCLQAGMDDYLAKPVDINVLHGLLRKWTERVDTGDRTATPPPGTASPQDQPRSPMVLDPDVLDELHDIIGASTQAIIDAFLQDTPALVQQLQDAAREEDPQSLRSLAHVLKSSSANVGATALSAVAQRIEADVRNGGLSQPTAAASRLVAEFARARIALSEWRPSSAR